MIRQLFLFALLPLGCLAAPAVGQSGSPVIALNGDIWDGNGGPFLTGNVYHIFSGSGSCCGRVPAGQTLTVQPGAIVKFDSSLTVQGTLIANGASFTSWLDDSLGGDSNGDGNATTPTPGAWESLEFSATSVGSVLHDCFIRYGGGSSKPMVWCRGADVDIARCDIWDSAGVGIEVDGTLSTVDDCDLNNNLGIPIDGVPPTGVPGITNNRGSNNAVGDYVRVESLANEVWTGPYAWSILNTLNQSGVIVVRAENANGTPILTIDPGGELILGEGLILKMQNRSWITARSTLTANGTAQNPVIFTSLSDDSIGGDTEKDGNTTTPAPGDWRRVQWAPGSDASRLTHVELRYGGNGGEAMLIDGGSPTLEDVRIRYSGGDGVRFRNPGTGPLQVEGLQILDCVGLALVDATWGFLQACRDLDFTNNGNDHITLRVETLNTGDTVALDPDQVPATLLITNQVRVFGDATLSLPPGTVVKFAADQVTGVNVNSTANLVCRGTAERPVVFTAERDDSVGGDVNLDGGVAAPIPGEWGRLFLGSAGASILEHVLVRYAGRNSVAAIAVQQGPSELRAVRVEHALSGGFRLNTLGAHLDNCVAWSCGGYGIRANSWPFDIRHATVVACGSDGITQVNGWTGSVRNSISWGNSGAAFGVLPVGQVFRSNGEGSFLGSNGNRNTNPWFVDEAGGDLRLSANSPLLASGDLGSGIDTIVDIEENHRLARGVLGGIPRADMGAHELSLWSLAITGEARPGATLTATVSGPPAGTFLVFGLLDGTIPLPGLGYVTVGNLTAQTASPLAPVGTPVPATIPNNPALLGLEAAVQGVCLSNQVGFTNRVRRVVY